jgi:LysM repeat protein
MAYTGYHFFLDDLEFPYAPSELKVSIGSNNETVTLISGQTINILKEPKLTEVEFDIELPRGRQYAFANKLVSTKTYTDKFEEMVDKKKTGHLVIIRPNPRSNQPFEGTDLIVSLESYTMKESADNAYDVVVSLKFKQYEQYGTRKQVVINKPTTPPAVQPAPKPADESKKYTVKRGDCLWKISKQFYGTGTKWKTIYNANKTVIENTAKKYGKKSSSNGWWIYPGTQLVIPSSK